MNRGRCSGQCVRTLVGALALLVLLPACTTHYVIHSSDEPADYSAVMVAGCVPQDLSGQISGPWDSVWVLCNDLDFAVEDVVESELVACGDVLDNGVVHALRIAEVRNRRWASFRVACVELGEDGLTVPSTVQWTPPRFDFDGSAEVFETGVADRHVATGIFEVYNRLQLRESLLRVALEHLPAEDVFKHGANGTWAENPFVSPRIPDASPLLLGTASWPCPTGMALTGAGIGHIPHANGRSTRPVYILGECRRVMKKVVRR